MGIPAHAFSTKNSPKTVLRTKSTKRGKGVQNQTQFCKKGSFRNAKIMVTIMVKKYVCMLLAVLTLSMVGCKTNEKTEVPNSDSLTRVKSSENPHICGLLLDNDADYLKSLLDGGNWDSGVKEETCDYIFELSDENGDAHRQVEYSSKTGLLNDTESDKHLVVSQEEKDRINKMAKDSMSFTHSSANVRYTSSNIRVRHKTSSKVIELSEEDQKYVMALWNDSVWREGYTKTACDYTFDLSDGSIDYEPHLGLFNDAENQRHLYLSGEEMDRVNKIIGFS